MEQYRNGTYQVLPQGQQQQLANRTEDLLKQQLTIFNQIQFEEIALQIFLNVSSNHEQVIADLNDLTSLKLKVSSDGWKSQIDKHYVILTGKILFSKTQYRNIDDLSKNLQKKLTNQGVQQIIFGKQKLNHSYQEQYDNLLSDDENKQINKYNNDKKEIIHAIETMQKNVKDCELQLKDQNVKVQTVQANLEKERKKFQDLSDKIKQKQKHDKTSIEETQNKDIQMNNDICRDLQNQIDNLTATNIQQKQKIQFLEKSDQNLQLELISKEIELCEEKKKGVELQQKFQINMKEIQLFKQSQVNMAEQYHHSY